VTWLAGQGYGARCVWRRVPQLAAFGEFARLNGARSLADLPGHVDAFVDKRVSESRRARRGLGSTFAKDVRGPVEQLLELVVPGFRGSGRPHHHLPFADALPGFFEYLTCERGLRPASVASYQHHLDRFEAWLGRVGVAGLHELSPALLSAFIAERSETGLAKTTMREGCSVLRVFLRYAHREGLVRGELWKSVEGPQVYRLSDIPRSISWEEVGMVLALADRRTPCGKRDYAILLLLATYGLRAREVAALTLDDIDWRRQRLAIPERKAGHSTAFPLSAAAGEALADYLRHGRPESPDRHVFFRAVAPLGRSAPTPSRAAPGATCCAPGSGFPARARTRCGTVPCSGWSTPGSRLRPSGTTPGTVRRPRRRSTPRWPWSPSARSPSVTVRRC
jgi:site-specific recombinase XerD